jgi:hypothetical protein
MSGLPLRSGAPAFRRRLCGLVAVLLGALCGLAGGAGTALAASCPHELPVSVHVPTANATALQKVGLVRVSVGGGAQVRNLQLKVMRKGRAVALGARAASFRGTARVKLAFKRKALPGAAEIAATGRVLGCDVVRKVSSALKLDGRNLAVDVVATDHDVLKRQLDVTIEEIGKQVISDIKAKVLDPLGQVIAEFTRKKPLHNSAHLDFVLRRSDAGRHVLLLTAGVRGVDGRASFAEPLDFDTQTDDGAVPGDGAPVAPPPAPPPGPPPGAVVQQASISWSGGQWEGNDSAGFTAPGIGDGQLVCRPDTQWLRFFPADRGRDVAAMLWTFHDWGGGSEFAIREPEMTQFTGPDFNEGFNKFQPAEKVSHGSFVGLIADGLFGPGSFGSGRTPTEVRLSWDWDFNDLSNAHCNVSATLTSAGVGDTGPFARGFSLGWNGAGGVPDDTTFATVIPGVGTVRLRCDPGGTGKRALILDPEATLPGLVLTTYQGSDRSDRVIGDVPYVLPLPNNGLVEAVAASGSPLRLIVSSRWKINDPDPTLNSCRVSGLAVFG